MPVTVPELLCKLSVVEGKKNTKKIGRSIKKISSERAASASGLSRDVVGSYLEPTVRVFSSE